MVETGLTPRLEARARRDFEPELAEQVIAFLRTVPATLAASRQDPERLQAAAFVLIEGDMRRIPKVQDMLTRDWRDILVWAGLGHADWPERLTELLGPPL